MEFTHLNKDDQVYMVDISKKKETSRTAKASGKIYLSKATINKIYDNDMPKKDVITTAVIAGIMAIKKTSELIPMAHNILINSSNIEFVQHDDYLQCIASASTTGKTGIEMEVITGVSIALATIYDMAKAVDKHMVISEIHLVEKTGGKTDFKEGENNNG
ncbi:cyclic pyranopterin monophosphate synthase MoaC [Mycoplasma sp. P36-A1]|uniref:cyclic pyranopterin monophosphate synthase MoaC n=1 Tax=Mycoplasma sp. P36-A1 TaxID=3252900 RepID=UPI003C2CFB72